MAIPIEFASVVFQRALVGAAFDGGLDAIAQLELLSNWAEDEYLVRVGFMSTREASMLVDSLSCGLEEQPGVAVLLSHDPKPPEWLAVGEIDGFLAGWLAGTEPGALASPIGVSHLYVLRAGTAWEQLIEAAGSSVTAVTGTNESSTLIRGDARVEAWLADRYDGKMILMLAQEIRRRRWFKEDGELMRDIVASAKTSLDGVVWE
ncbi:MAG: hypothetical protein HOW73_22530 [Polyangiaceae bacterium]|nr:hypothetical protein [Polyangiaceae bacterium]